MVYQGDSLQLHSVQIILDNEVNTVSICRDWASSIGNEYTVVEIKQHDISKNLLTHFFMDIAADKSKDILISSFSCNNSMVLVFPYSKPRPLTEFYVGEKLKLQESERICNNLVLSCITCGLPYQMLYLLLKQKLIHLTAANEVYFTYAVDFTEYDDSISEKECVVECAKILLELLRPHANDRKMVSYILLQKRVASAGYTRFTELYKDITISAADAKRRGFFPRIFDWFDRNRDALFRALLVICVILVIIVGASFLTQVIFGDIPWLRILFGNFKHIGTESLLQ